MARISSFRWDFVRRGGQSEEKKGQFVAEKTSSEIALHPLICMNTTFAVPLDSPQSRQVVGSLEVTKQAQNWTLEVEIVWQVQPPAQVNQLLGKMFAVAKSLIVSLQQIFGFKVSGQAYK